VKIASPSEDAVVVTILDGSSDSWYGIGVPDTMRLEGITGGRERLIPTASVVALDWVQVAQSPKRGEAAPVAPTHVQEGSVLVGT